MHCTADACNQGRAACPAPMTCSGAAPLVDQSIAFWKLHRLQDVRSVDDRWDAPRPSVYLTRPLAPGVIDKGDDSDEWARQEGALAACIRWLGVAALLWIAAFVVLGYLAAALRWI